MPKSQKTVQQIDFPFNLQTLSEADGTRPARIVGTAAVYGVRFERFWGLCKLAPGCFRKTLSERPDILALYGHDQTQVLGRTKSGTLTLEDNPVGLRAVITPPDTTWAADVMTSLRRGDLGGMSIGAEVLRWKKTKEPDGEIVEVWQEIKLFEVSVVAMAAIAETEVYAVMSARGLQPAHREHLSKLRRDLDNVEKLLL